MSEQITAARLDRIFAQAFGDYRQTPDGVKGKGRAKDFSAKIKEEFNHILDDHPDTTFGDFRTEILDRIEDRPESFDRGCVDRDAAVDEFLEVRDITISENGKEITSGPHTDMAPQDLKDSFKDFAIEKNIGLSRDDTKYSGEALYVRFMSRIHEQTVATWLKIMDELKFNKSAAKQLPDMLGEVLRAIRVDDSNTVRFEADKRMLAHFMWSVKRRIIELDFSPALPVMLVFHGRQGGGKTSFIENHLFSVFRDKVVSADLGILHDSREFRKYVDNIIVNFDELSLRGLNGAKQSRTPEVLKQLLTSASSQERTFFTQSQQTYRIRASFCATSNKPLAESICDPTGMRRFWEIKSQKNLEFDWEVLESFDWVKLWSAVNEKKQFGYFSKSHKLYSFVDKIQDSFCVQPSLRRWFFENYEIPKIPELHGQYAIELVREEDHKANNIRSMTPLTLYGEYADAMKDLDNYAVSQSSFFGQMEKLGLQKISKSRTHSRSEHFVVQAL